MKFELPSWLRKSKLKLPPWAKIGADASAAKSGKVSVVIDVDTPGYVAEWFRLLDVKQTDQYWLEVAYQCAKLDVQAAISGTEFDPRISGKAAEFHFSRSDDHALVRHPTGRGVEAASRGREAREHYRRVRGSLPM